MSRRMRINIVNMGCSKNMVDSERLARCFEEAGYEVSFDDPAFTDGEVIINTCGFISDAKEESINMILSAAELRRRKKISGLHVMGCLAQRYATELPSEIPEVDTWCGKFDWNVLLDKLKIKHLRQTDWQRKLATPPHMAYVKIAEGCNRFCAFCAIPLITGRYKSRPVTEVLEEVKDLAAKGVKEYNIIAQDLSYYGRDLGDNSALATLLEEMAQVPGVEFIRLHYAYPFDFPYDILPVMARHPQICKYLDIALQHISDTVLTNMNRHISATDTRALLARIRREVPGIHIRTTLMVGFPGEGEREFEELMDFVREQRFERMGAFAYCEEEDTTAAKNFADDIPQEVKQERLDRLMALQQEIAADVSQAKVGTRQRVIIDTEEVDYYVGRTQYSSPEVDPVVMVEKTRKMSPGEIVEVEITRADVFEIFGKE